MPFSCGTCGKTYDLKSELMKHKIKGKCSKKTVGTKRKKKENIREAPDAGNGFSYQHYQCAYECIKAITSKKDLSIVEEGYEDIDIISNQNGEREIIQVKFHQAERSKESLTKKSGLWKVLKSILNRGKEVKHIEYRTYSLNKEVYLDEIEQLFSNKTPENLEKIRIKMILIEVGESLTKYYDVEKARVRCLLAEETEPDDPEIVFWCNQPLANEFLNKIDLTYGDDVPTLERKIREEISKEFNTFLNESTSIPWKGLKLDYLHQLLNNKLIKTLIEGYKGREKRTLKVSEVRDELFATASKPFVLNAVINQYLDQLQAGKNYLEDYSSRIQNAFVILYQIAFREDHADNNTKLTVMRRILIRITELKGARRNNIDKDFLNLFVLYDSIIKARLCSSHDLSPDETYQLVKLVEHVMHRNMPTGSIRGKIKGYIYRLFK